MYDYQEQKHKVFQEENQKIFLNIRDFIAQQCKASGAVRVQEITFISKASDSWLVLACIDRLIELGEIYEVTNNKVATQNKVFCINEG